MAYLIGITLECHQDGCPKLATKRLYNRLNSRIGDFCAKHAEAKLKVLLAAESHGAPQRAEGHS